MIYQLETLGRWFLGDFDGLLAALAAFTVIDLLSTILVVLLKRSVTSSRTLPHQLATKVMVFLMVGIGQIIDAYLVMGGNTFRMVVICFYIKDTGLNILRNALVLDVPIPEPVKNFLKDLLSDSNGESDKTGTRL